MSIVNYFRRIDLLLQDVRMERGEMATGSIWKHQDTAQDNAYRI